MLARLYLGLSIMTILGFFNNDAQASQGAAKPAETKGRVAYFNEQTILPNDEHLLDSGSLEWKDFYLDLKKKVDPAREELKKLNTAFEKGKTEFQNLQQSKLTSQDALRQKYEEVMAIQQDGMARSQELEAYIQKEDYTAKMAIKAKLHKVADSIRAAQGWDAISSIAAVYSLDPKLDLTSQVITALNKDYAAEKAKKASAPKKDEPKKPVAL